MAWAKSYQESRQQIEQLVERFARNQDVYTRPEYKETQVRRVHLPLFSGPGLPVRAIDFSDPTGVARHDRMVALVECILDLQQKLAAATVPADQRLYQRQIEIVCRRTDALVYELYGLSEEEIGVVEGAKKKGLWA